MKNKVFILIGAILAVVVLFTIMDKAPVSGGKYEIKIPDLATNSASTGSANSQIKTVNMYVDRSASMKGYIDLGAHGEYATTTYNSTLRNLLTNCKSKYGSQTAIYLNLGKGEIKDLFDVNKYQGENSLLGDWIEDVCAQVTDSTINVLVSDMIMSFGSNKLKKENDHWLNKTRLNDLGARIYEAASGLKKNGYDIVVLQYLTDYNGKYYDNCTEDFESGNAFDKVLMKNRPFYLMIMGKREFLENMLENNCFEPYKNIWTSFCDVEYKSVGYTLISEVENVWHQPKDNVQKEQLGTIALKSATLAQGYDNLCFTLISKEFKMPERYMNSTGLKLTTEVVEGVSLVENVTAEMDNGLQLKVFPQRFGDVKDRRETIKINVLAPQTDWDWATSSIDNDVNVTADTLEKRTWGVETFMDNLRKAYEQPEFIKVAEVEFDLYCKEMR